MPLGTHVYTFHLSLPKSRIAGSQDDYHVCFIYQLILINFQKCFFYHLISTYISLRVFFCFTTLPVLTISILVIPVTGFCLQLFTYFLPSSTSFPPVPRYFSFGRFRGCGGKDSRVESSCGKEILSFDFYLPGSARPSEPKFTSAQFSMRT